MTEVLERVSERDLLSDAYTNGPLALWQTMEAVIDGRLRRSSLSEDRKVQLRIALIEECDAHALSAQITRQLSPIAFANEFLEILKEHGV